MEKEAEHNSVEGGKRRRASDRGVLGWRVCVCCDKWVCMCAFVRQLSRMLQLLCRQTLFRPFLMFILKFSYL